MISSDLQRKVADLFLKGLSNAEIARELNMTRNSISGILSRIRTSSKELTAARDAIPDTRQGDEEILNILRLRDAGFNFVEVARRVRRPAFVCKRAFDAVMAEAVS